ncbi:MAG: hypothetical protein A2600_11235 [Candidatus Lambdaproteobacteria bacterium RIFOXYD1_FULL_56_27]|uniref:Uncharacterized protein n=1 Tax=Candidatus Lambdaproteobacteria bacterium RIFOXYD2_FULL_56_26 TaxID=1817773 RepID=A0A1F6GZG3_9PROT|nr:MAG: hypothetical protein A2426_08490 [Candidatus Lambdaproteobacteria bacterium RIFOXYC1_FULL_56_13]OGH03553.1 MAG: hypothetical protein A2557_01210 [Candidatus Lambdaproteobacteria bacterium RIFOXYD2_FULL_56_26]OGH07661.1 MAG: hypothetical protein A2600_11235 [Candidatus Lambdaproteobacteria bacterium RIFOXYD1_FULL_56_27]
MKQQQQTIQRLGLVLVLLSLGFLVGCKSKKNDNVVVNGTTTSTESAVQGTANSPKSLSFTDSDPLGSLIQGSLTIVPAEDESSTDSYEIYWGNSSTSLLAGQSVIASKDKVGANLTYSFAQGSAVPSGATYFLVYGKNSQGLSEPPTALAVADAGTASSSLFGSAWFGYGKFGP